MIRIIGLFLLLPIFYSAQEQSFKKPKQDLFFSMDGNLGLGIGSLINSSKDSNDYNNQQNNTEDKTNFTYGVNANVGYHFTPHFSASTGMKYSYINPNFHPIFWTFQTAYHFNLTNENTAFTALYYGSKINTTEAMGSDMYGVKVGLLTPKKKFLNLSASGFLEYQSFANSSDLFIGLNVGFTIFTGTNNL